jgi:hypothetical protein
MTTRDVLPYFGSWQELFNALLHDPWDGSGPGGPQATPCHSHGERYLTPIRIHGDRYLTPSRIHGDRYLAPIRCHGDRGQSPLWSRRRSA